MSDQVHWMFSIEKLHCAFSVFEESSLNVKDLNALIVTFQDDGCCQVSALTRISVTLNGD